MDLTKDTDKLLTNFFILKNIFPKSSLNMFNNKKNKLYNYKIIKILLIFLFLISFFMIFNYKDIIL